MMTLFALCAALLAGPAQPPADTLPEDFSFQLPVKTWHPADVRFDTGAKHLTLVFFFSPTCGHCHKAWPEVEAWSREFSRRGVVFEAVASGYSTKEDLEWFEKDFGPFTYPIFQDTAKALGSRMKVRSVPTFFLVDQYGGYRKWVGSFPATMSDIENTILHQLRWRTGHL